MRLLCISASNTLHMGRDSASTRVCELAGEIARERFPTGVEVEVAPLMEYDFSSCTFCGRCRLDGCPSDPDFRRLLAKISGADGIVLVVPHYACVPAKLTQVLEKLNQLLYINWCVDNNYTSPLQGKPVGLIAHGGSAETGPSNAHLQEVIVNPVSYVLRSLGLSVLSASEGGDRGTAFGLDDAEAIRTVEGKLLPDIEHNWERIRARIAPLVLRVVESAM